MVVGQLPFSADGLASSPDCQRLLFERIQSADIRIPAFLSRPLADLLKGLLVRDPTARLTVANALAHPWCNAGVIGRGITNTELDRDILASLAGLKVDVAQLKEDMQRGDHTPLTAMYLSLERECLIDAQKNMKSERPPSAWVPPRKTTPEACRAPHVGVTMQVAAIKARNPLAHVRMCHSQRRSSLANPGVIPMYA
jgi:serine/threonine protein kinase